MRPLQALWEEIADLGYAAAVLEWDQLVNMPPGGAEARGQQLATLRRLAHDRLASSQLGEALAAAEAALGGGPLGGDPSDPAQVARAWLRVARRERDRAARVPSALVEEMARAETEGYFAWVQAREQDSFSAFRPALARLLRLAREHADALGHSGQRYDALLALHEPGLATSALQALFDRLRQALPPLVAAIRERPQLDRGPLRQRLAEDAQRRLGEAAISAFGYDWRRGRQDRSVHPFSTSFGSGDCRITTRFAEDDAAVALFATLHEAGHALYEQGIPAAWRRGPLGQAASTGVHESQSRLWENQVGRSRAFWAYFTPVARRLVPGAFGGCSPEELYRAANTVEPGPIRVEADEVTYNLHVALRFELELGLLSGDLPVDELPGAWNRGMRAALGLEPRGDREGCLQDVHWSGGSFGYFPSYTLGTVLSAQWMRAAEAELPSLPEQLGIRAAAGLAQGAHPLPRRDGDPGGDGAADRRDGDRPRALPGLSAREVRRAVRDLRPGGALKTGPAPRRGPGARRRARSGPAGRDRRARPCGAGAAGPGRGARHR
jgi:carboxypeptidase Taq